MLESIIEDFAPATSSLIRPIPCRNNDELEIDVSDDLSFYLLKPFSTRPSGLRMMPSYNLQQQNLRKRFPEGKLTRLGLQVPVTDTSSLLLSKAMPQEQVTYSPEAYTVMQRSLALFIKAQRSATLQAKSKAKVPFTEREFAPLPNGMKYMEHQKYAAECAIGNPSYALFMEQGTGKTLVCIMRIDEESRVHPTIFRSLVICPKGAQTNWKIELKEFSTTRGESFIMRGDKLDREKRMLDSLRCTKDHFDWSCCIVSYESFGRTLPAISAIPWDLVIVDEAHYAKDGNTARAKNLFILRGGVRQAMVLTGSPIVNGPVDLYVPFEFIGEGVSGFSNSTEFKKFYSKYFNVDANHSIFLGAQNVPFLQERLARYSFTCTQEEVLPDLPKMSYVVEEVEMSPKQKKIYKQVADSLRVESEEAIEHSENLSITINHVLTRMLRLAQITSGFVTWDAVYDPETAEELRPKTIEAFDPNPKMDALLEFIKKTPKVDKSILWCCWRLDIQTWDTVLTEAGIKHVNYYGDTREKDRDLAITQFNEDPDTSVFLGNPECAGIAVNLLGQASPKHDAVYIHEYSQNWKPAVRGQGEKRNHRKGTRRPVYVYDWQVPGSIDERIRAVVMKKRKAAAEITDIREILTEVTQCLGLF